jgi:beta-mannosidase
LGDTNHSIVRITTPDGVVLEKKAPVPTSNEVVIEVPIPKPELWWPNGYGRQPLYKVDVSLISQDTLNDEPLDSRSYQIGLRTIELRQQQDQWGRSFAFVVNGVPIFAKGSNWIPADSGQELPSNHEGLIHQRLRRTRTCCVGRWPDEDERFMICAIATVSWSGRVHLFVQHLPAGYPEFLENVELVLETSADYVIASLALWCGNNEMEWGWVDWNWNRPELQDLKAAYNQFFHHTLPEWCHTEDPEHAYWPSSPSSDTPFIDPNGQRQGDAHYWDVWHGGKPFSSYRYQFPRFMSEFGFQALPPLATIRTYADEADWNMTSYIMEQHQKNASGNSMLVRQMLDMFRLPRNFESLVYLSMVLQAEGIRYGVEHWRRHPDQVAGTLYWQLNDCWPVASWSSLDYFGRWKALHYAARRFYAPVMLSIEDSPPRQSVYVTNDLLSNWEGQVKWSLETFDAQVLDSGASPVHVAPQSATSVCDLDFHPVTDDVCAGWFHRELASRELDFARPLLCSDKTPRSVEPAIRAALERTQALISIWFPTHWLSRWGCPWLGVTWYLAIIISICLPDEKSS